MSDSPEVVVRFNEQGAKATVEAVTATDKQLTKLNRQLKAMTERADMAKLQAGSAEYLATVKRLKEEQDALTKSFQKEVTVADKLNDQLKEMTANTALLRAQAASPEFAEASKSQKAAQDALTDSLGEQKSALDRMGEAANKINEIFDAAGKAVGIASDLGKMANEMASAGAVALDIAKAYEKLGDAAPGVEELQAASAGVVDKTSLQGFANLASEIGATKEEIQGATQNMTFLADEHGKLAEEADLLNKLVKGEVEGLRELGFVVDLTSAEFEGLSEAEKKLAVFQSFASQGTQEQVDAMDSAQAAILRQSTAMADLQSDAETAFAEFVIGSGVLDMLGDAIDFVSGFVRDNSALFEELGEIAKTVAGIVGKVLGPTIERLASWFEVATTVLGPLLDGLEVLVDANNALGDIIPDLNDVANTFFITDMPKFTKNQKTLNVEMKSFGERALDTAIALRREKEAAEETARAIERIRTTQFDSQVQRLDRIKSGFAERDLLERTIDSTKGLDSAVDDLTIKYGDAEGAIEALGSSITRLESGASAAQSALQKTSNPAMIALFTRQRDELNLQAAGVRELTDALGTQIDQRDAIKTSIDKQTSSTDRGKKARAEAIRTQDEFNDSLAVGAIGVAAFGSVVANSIYIPADNWNTGHPGGLIGSILHGNDPDSEGLEAAAEIVFGLGDVVRSQIYEPADAWGTTNPGGLLGLLFGDQDEYELDRIAEAEAGMLALGDATVYSADKLGGWGDKASVVMSASIGLAEGLQQSASGADKFSAVLSASEAVTKGAIDDTGTEAVVLGLMSGARSAMAFASGNFVGGLGYAGASAQFFATAAFAGKGGGGGGGGGGSSAAATAASSPTAADVFEQPEAAGGGGGGGTVIFNIQALNREGVAETVLDILNEHGESGGGGQLHPSLVGLQQGRSGA